MKKTVKLVFVVAIIMFVLTGCCLKHEWKDATCVDPLTCAVCDKSKGEPHGHVWSDATCVDPMTCKVCGETSGEALGHEWDEATCLDPKTCKVCNETEGDALGHDWEAANCNTPQTCRRCATEEGEKLEHVYSEATCVTKSTCQLCGKTTGKLAEHTYEKNVCTLCGDIMIENYAELEKYLNKNYDELVTPVGTVKDIEYHIVDNNPPLYKPCDYELQIRSSLWCDDSNAGLFSLIRKDYYTYEERLEAFVALLKLEYEVSQIAIEAFPDKKMKGYIYEYGYEYPNLQVGFHSVSYLMFANYTGPIHVPDYKRTTLGSWFMDEENGDQFLNKWDDDGFRLCKDAKKITGYDLTFSLDYYWNQ